MSLFFDVTKSHSAKQISGLIRVSKNLRQALEAELGNQFVPVIWHPRKQCFLDLSKRMPSFQGGRDCFITPEIFSPEERPGFFDALQRASIWRAAAIFHDAIPVTHPEITWSRSVARHPSYMMGLLHFNHIFCVSEASRIELLNYWSRLKTDDRPGSSVLALGSDFLDRSQCNWRHDPQVPPMILCIGILEPRKNQSGVLDAALPLWDAGLQFELHFVGRVNPEFGRPVEKKIKRARKSGYPVYLHLRQRDGNLLELYSKTRFTVFNSNAEGFGLPVVESLWMGIPCISTRLPSLAGLHLEPACFYTDGPDTLKNAMKAWISQPELVAKAADATKLLSLPRWKDTARTIVDWMGNL